MSTFVMYLPLSRSIYLYLTIYLYLSLSLSISLYTVRIALTITLWCLFGRHWYRTRYQVIHVTSYLCCTRQGFVYNEKRNSSVTFRPSYYWYESDELRKLRKVTHFPVVYRIPLKAIKHMLKYGKARYDTVPCPVPVRNICTVGSISKAGNATNNMRFYNDGKGLQVRHYSVRYRK